MLADSPGRAYVATMSERGIVIHTFEAEMSDELTVRTGEQVHPKFLTQSEAHPIAHIPLQTFHPNPNDC